MSQPGSTTPFPQYVFVAISNICNLNCVMCRPNQNSAKKGFMDFGLYCKVMDELKSLGVKGINIYNVNEPLLHPQFLDMLYKAQELDMS